MRSFSPLRTAAFLFLVLPVAACGQAPAERPGQTFAQFEARGMGRLMARDTDGDGRISRAEFLAGHKAGRGDPDRRFARLDADGNGMVDRGEIAHMLRRRFDRIDANHDGIVTAAERAAMHRARSGDDQHGQAG